MEDMNLLNITYDHIDDLSSYPHIIFLGYLSVPSVVFPHDQIIANGRYLVVLSSPPLLHSVALMYIFDNLLSTPRITLYDRLIAMGVLRM